MDDVQRRLSIRLLFGLNIIHYPSHIIHDFTAEGGGATFTKPADTIRRFVQIII